MRSAGFDGAGARPGNVSPTAERVSADTVKSIARREDWNGFENVIPDFASTQMSSPDRRLNSSSGPAANFRVNVSIP